MVCKVLSCRKWSLSLPSPGRPQSWTAGRKALWAGPSPADLSCQPQPFLFLPCGLRGPHLSCAQSLQPKRMVYLCNCFTCMFSPGESPVRLISTLPLSFRSLVSVLRFGLPAWPILRGMGQCPQLPLMPLHPPWEGPMGGSDIILASYNTLGLQFFYLRV